MSGQLQLYDRHCFVAFTFCYLCDILFLLLPSKGGYFSLIHCMDDDLTVIIAMAPLSQIQQSDMEQGGCGCMTGGDKNMVNINALPTI